MSLLAGCSIAWGEPKPEVRKPDEELTYRKVGDVELKLEVFRPRGWKPSDSRPAVVFFFGGGWVGGSTTQFHPCLLYTSPSPRDVEESRMPSSA